MGVFEYECPRGHVTDHLVSLAERPQTITCKTEGCGETASYIISAAKTTFHANDRKAIKGNTVNRGGIRT
jgi:hypothetical protein